MLVVTTSVNTVEGAIQAGIGLFVVEQLLTYLPSRFGGPSLTIVLFAFGALTYAQHPEGVLEYQKRRSTLRFERLFFPAEAPPRRLKAQASVGWCQWLTSNRSSVSMASASPSAGSRPCTASPSTSVRGRASGSVGPNGAGKTTLFNCVCGQLRPEEGDIVFDGSPLLGLPTYKRARMGIGRTYQRVEVFTDMTVRDHLLVAERSRRGEGRLWRDLLNMSKPKHDEMDRVDATLELVGISDLADTRSTPSDSGHCRLVELARALATEPKILLADEPSSGLDLHETAEVAAVLRTVQRERGTAVLLVEHDLTMVAEVVDRAVVMDLGSMLFAGTFDECMADPAVRDAYLGQMGHV